MTLFDGQLLTEEEILRRLPCRCGCLHREHANGGPCLSCNYCDQFEDAAEFFAEDEQ